jgi:Cu/Zn superoxide dismutase
MKKIVIAVVATALTLGIAPLAQASSTSVTKLVVKATGVNESANTGATKGSSAGIFILNTAKNTICSTVKTSRLAGVTGAHIHKGAKGVDGAVVIPFNVAKFNKSGQTCVKVAHSLLVNIAKNPDMYYFNVHTKVIPSGAVRGQLSR